jgi:hypothetical protein
VIIRHQGGMVELIDLDPFESWIPLLAPAIEEAARALPRRTGLSLPARARVVVSGDVDTFGRLAGRPASSWLLGVARQMDGIAVLNGSLLKPGPERNAIGTLRHELAHLAMGTAAERGGPIPRWFDEGVASWFAGGYADFGPLDLAPALTRRELTLPRLTFAFPDDLDGMRIAYAKSQLAIELLEEMQGSGTVAAIGSSLATGVPFEEALVGATGIGSEELERELRRREAPHGVFFAVLRRALSPFLIMAFLTVVGFTLRRLRLRRRMRRWELEEGEPGEGGQDERER